MTEKERLLGEIKSASMDVWKNPAKGLARLAACVSEADRLGDEEAKKVARESLRIAGISKRITPEQTVAAIREVCKTSPGDAYAFLILGDAEARVGNPEAAKKAYSKALALSPDDHHLADQVAKGLHSIEGK